MVHKSDNRVRAPPPLTKGLGLIRFGRCARERRLYGYARMEPAEDLLRRLAFNDEKALSMVLTRTRGGKADGDLTPKVELLVQLAAMLAVGASTTLLDEIVADASRLSGSSWNFGDDPCAICN